MIKTQNSALYSKCRNTRK